MKQKAIIVDLDGTLCDTTHRQHFMEGTKRWKSFYENMVHDKPNLWCLSLIDGMRGIAEIVFVSGRPDSYYEHTQDWLRKHGLHIWPLFMRKEDDFRKDSIIKTELYNTHIRDQYDVLFCVDDRQQVVDAWRDLGLTCLQCAKGDF